MLELQELPVIFEIFLCIGFLIFDSLIQYL